MQAKEPRIDAEYLGELEVKCWGPGIKWGWKEGMLQRKNE